MRSRKVCSIPNETAENGQSSEDLRQAADAFADFLFNEAAWRQASSLSFMTE